MALHVILGKQSKNIEASTVLQIASLPTLPSDLLLEVENF
jgi:hypothetical protein